MPKVHLGEMASSLDRETQRIFWILRRAADRSGGDLVVEFVESWFKGPDGAIMRQYVVPDNWEELERKQQEQQQQPTVAPETATPQAAPEVDQATIKAAAAEVHRAAANVKFDEYPQFFPRQHPEIADHNRALVVDFINKRCTGYMSAEAVDAAVLNLGERGTNQLKKAAPVPPPPPIEPPEVLGRCSDGSPQKSLKDTPQAGWSQAQLKDFLRRQREVSGIKPPDYSALQHLSRFSTKR